MRNGHFYYSRLLRHGAISLHRVRLEENNLPLHPNAKTISCFAFENETIPAGLTGPTFIISNEGLYPKFSPLLQYFSLLFLHPTVKRASPSPFKLPKPFFKPLLDDFVH